MRDDPPDQLLRERKKAWWTSVLTGQSDEPYPDSGTHLVVRLDGDTLMVSGTVSSERDRAEIQADVDQLIGHGVTDVKLDFVAATDPGEQMGLLVQTLVGIFDSEPQAQFAARYCESQGNYPGRLGWTVAGMSG